MIFISHIYWNLYPRETMWEHSLNINAASISWRCPMLVQLPSQIRHHRTSSNLPKEEQKNQIMKYHKKCYYCWRWSETFIVAFSLSLNFNGIAFWQSEWINFNCFFATFFKQHTRKLLLVSVLRPFIQNSCK